ncbi:MAG: ribonuclease R [Candidatus Gracilibacteria bacterium]|nr:ribonuclease R [Candidatus Gracilibacteria bacterium]
MKKDVFQKKDFKKNIKKSSFQKEEKKPFLKPKSDRYKNYSKKDEDYSNLEKIIGVYSQSKNNDYGFVDVDGQEKGYFVYPRNLNSALDGDQVEAVLKIFNRRKEAVITKIITRADRVLVGTIELVKDFAFVILDNPAFKNDVHISNKKLSKFKGLVKNGDKVAIKITLWEGKNPEGSIIEILGDKNKPGIEIESILLEGGIRVKFGEGILQEAKELKFEEQKYRTDLTKTLIFTIDSEDARDLDDAIFVEKIGNDYKLIVSIADVAEYVKEGSLLDKEALKRGNSTYLVDRVIPMLPEKLSNDLCSLNPNTKKLALSCEMIIDNKGNVISKKVYESVISSKFRLTYREVQEILDGKLNIGDKLFFGGIISNELFEAIKISLELKTIITTRKQKSGILDFDFPETKIILDENKNPIDIKKYERYESMKIIEEFMILANESIGEMFSKMPFVYRIHPIPNYDDIEKLRNTLHIFGIDLPFKTITPKIIGNILHEISLNPKEKLLSKLVLRSLEKAIYSHENVGHFGLNLEFYSHFTSPIRRYPDLQIHRIIKEKLHNNLSKIRIEHYKNILKDVCKKTSDTERKSEKLEYAVKDLMICKYYENKIGEEFEGIISGVISAGFFVELENTAEGFVSIEQVFAITKHRKANFQEENMKFEITKDFSLQVGDNIKIKISNIELDKRRLNFDFLEKIIK